MAAPQHSIKCSKTLQNTFFRVQHPQNRVWGPTTDHSCPRNAVLGQTIGFLWAKNIINLKSHESSTVSLQSTFMCSKVNIKLFWVIFCTLHAITQSKGHARSQIVACQGSCSTRDKLHQFEITQKRERFTIIDIYVFKSANIAVLVLILHPPCHNLEQRACTVTSCCLPTLT